MGCEATPKAVLRTRIAASYLGSGYRATGLQGYTIDVNPPPMLSYTSCFGCPSQGETGNR